MNLLLHAMLIVINFNLSRSFFYRDLLLAA